MTKCTFHFLPSTYFYAMIDVTTATQQILDTALSFGVETIALEDAPGRVLAQDIFADRDFPPFDRVTMDGIAIRYADYAAGHRRFRVAGVGPAGAPQAALPSEPGACIEIMTGAVLPAGADAIVRYEDLNMAEGYATLAAPEVRAGQNIHCRAEDRPVGGRIISAGSRLRAAELGVAATVGLHQLQVCRLPEAVVISSGDELVPITGQPLDHQIRASNAMQIAALLRGKGVNADLMHLPDDAEVIGAALAEALVRYPLVVLSGGVSAGKFDYVPEALARLGVQQLFYQVAQRPGKPFWFGVHPGGARVFALPGNPVSSFMCAHRYVLPWLDACVGLPALPEVYAQLASDLPFKPPLAYFPPVRLRCLPAGQWLADPLPGHGSGDLANLVEADAFLELPAGQDVYRQGESFRVWRWA
jgi:molybdopterin molybdotransferase